MKQNKKDIKCLNISMSRQLHDEFEAFCKQTGMKKTNACEKAIQEYMDKMKKILQNKE